MVNKQIKIKNLIELNEISLIREYFENQGISNLTDEEIDACYGVCEGHGYELFTTNMKSGKLYQVDEEIAYDKESVLNSDTEDYFTIHDVKSFVSNMIDESAELCQDRYKCRYEETDINSWKDYFKTHNRVLDMNSKIRESLYECNYTVSVASFDASFNELTNDKKSFKSEIEVNKYVDYLVFEKIRSYGVSNMKDLESRYDLKEPSELDKFLIELREYSDIGIAWGNSYLSISIEEQKNPKLND